MLAGWCRCSGLRRLLRRLLRLLSRLRRLRLELRLRLRLARGLALLSGHLPLACNGVLLWHVGHVLRVHRHWLAGIVAGCHRLAMSSLLLCLLLLLLCLLRLLLLLLLEGKLLSHHGLCLVLALERRLVGRSPNGARRVLER